MTRDLIELLLAEDPFRISNDGMTVAELPPPGKLRNPDGPEAAALIREMDELLFDSLYHLRVDEAAKAYHEKVEALRAKASQ